MGTFVWNFCFGTFVGNFRGELLFGNFWGNPRPFCLALQFARGTLAPPLGEPAEATHSTRTSKITSKNPSSLRLVREIYIYIYIYREREREREREIFIDKCG